MPTLGQSGPVSDGNEGVLPHSSGHRDRILFPPLHINLGLIKLFNKALDKDGDWFTYLCQVFPVLTMEKLKAGIFDGPQIRLLIRNPGCNMSVQMRHDTLPIFTYEPVSWEPRFNNEQGERFHQDLKEMETRYQGRWGAGMMVDYCWNLKRDLPAAEHSRKSKKRKFKPWSLNNG